MIDSDREHFWVSYFAVTIAQALVSRDPEKILRPALQRFMRESCSNTVRAQIFTIIKEEQINGRR